MKNIMKDIIVWGNLSDKERSQMLSRPVKSASFDFRDSVGNILRSVAEGGDSAIRRYSKEFDGAELIDLEVSRQDIERSAVTVSAEFKRSVDLAVSNIRKFHMAQLRPSINIEVMEGVSCQRLYRPIETVGLYAPSGSAPLPSTVLMLGVPAVIAGCPEIVLCAPPGKNGEIDPLILYTAGLVGIHRVFKIGGAQAIGAMAYGTQTVPKVDKIYGPGNAWVTEAKLQVSHQPSGPAIDMPAGPSEVLVMVDEKSDPEFAAADLLSQAEHGEDSQVILVSTSAIMIDKITSCLEDQLERLPRRSIALKALENSRFILAKSTSEAVDISNRYAPEHLILQCADAVEVLDRISNAGSIFVGKYSPESVGDYASGTNHVLPTYGYAKAYSGLSVEAFQKSITVQELSEVGLKNIGPAVEVLAESEGLEAHKQAVSIRLGKLRK